jgi:hypothetical protein
MGGACSTYERQDRAYRVLMGRPEGRRLLVRSRRRWENNIKTDLQGKEWGTDWIDLAHNRDRWRAIVNAVMNLRVPQNAGNFLTSWEPVSFSRRTVLHGVTIRKYTYDHAVKPYAYFVSKERLAKPVYYVTEYSICFLIVLMVALSHNRPHWLWGPPSLLVNWYRGFFPRGQSGRGVKLITHLHLVPMTRMSGAVPLFPLYAFRAHDRW